MRTTIVEPGASGELGLGPCRATLIVQLLGQHVHVRPKVNVGIGRHGEPADPWRVQPSAMRLDHGTLRDLEIFASNTIAGATMVGYLDYTRTTVGRQQLHRRLRAPLSDPARICQTQDACRALAQDLEWWRRALDDLHLDEVQRYLDLRWQRSRAKSAAARAVEGLSIRLRHGDFLADIGAGREHLRTFLVTVAVVVPRLRATDAALLHAMADRLQELVDTPELKTLDRLIRRHHASTTLLAVDSHARGAARAPIIRLVEQLGDLEATWSLSTATVRHRWTYPLVDTGGLRIEGLVHPFLGDHAVANDLELDARTRVCFVTGPNMAGKSTFLKAVAVALWLAHLGCGVPARSMRFTPVGALFSSVHITDDIGAGESFYLAEVRRMRALAQLLADVGSTVALIDEPFRGTNVHDAAEATRAVLTRLARQPSAVVFVASHLAEVVVHLDAEPQVRLFHFAADLEEGVPTFDYQVRPGVSAQRLGMTLLHREGVLDLLDRASAATSVT